MEKLSNKFVEEDALILGTKPGLVGDEDSNPIYSMFAKVASNMRNFTNFYPSEVLEIFEILKPQLPQRSRGRRPSISSLDALVGPS